MITIAVLIVILSIIALIVILLHFSVKAYFHVGGDGVVFRVKYLWFDLYPRKPKKDKKPKKIKEPKRRSVKEEKADIKERFDDDLGEEISDYELMHGISEDKEDKLIEQAEKNIDTKKTDSVTQATESKADEKITEPVSKISAEKPKKNNKRKKEKKSATKGNNQPKQGIKDKISGLRAKYEKIKPYIPTGWKYFKKLLKTVRIRVVSARVYVAREDAHEAAIYYGAVQGLIANLLSVISEMFTVSVSRCDVDCGFTENAVNGEADFSVRIRPSALIAIAVCVGIKFLIIRSKIKKATNEIADGTPQAV